MHTIVNRILKRVILLFFVCFIATNLYSQFEKKNSVGVHTAFGSGSYDAVGVKGAGSNDVKYYYTIGLDYSRWLSNRLELCSGIEYTYPNF